MSITVYSRTTCAPCKSVKEWLTRKGIQFTEKLLDNNEENLQEVVSLTGMTMTPVTVVNGQAVAGMNISAIANLIFSLGAPVDPQDENNCEGCQ